MTFDIDSLTKKIDEIQNVYKTLKRCYQGIQ